MATMTTAQHREQVRGEYNAFLDRCPARQFVAAISDKWVPHLIDALAERPRRYGELATLVAGISQKMLTQTLRTLERDGFVVRTVTVSVPVRVDYRLTPLGQTLMPVLLTLQKWADEHIDEVQTARDEYDARQSLS